MDHITPDRHLRRVRAAGDIQVGCIEKHRLNFDWLQGAVSAAARTTHLTWKRCTREQSSKGFARTHSGRERDERAIACELNGAPVIEVNAYGRSRPTSRFLSERSQDDRALWVARVQTHRQLDEA